MFLDTTDKVPAELDAHINLSDSLVIRHRFCFKIWYIYYIESSVFFPLLPLSGFFSCMSFAAYHLSPATCHLSPAPCNLPPSIYHLPPATGKIKRPICKLSTANSHYNGWNRFVSPWQSPVLYEWCLEPVQFTRQATLSCQCPKISESALQGTPSCQQGHQVWVQRVKLCSIF